MTVITNQIEAVPAPASWADAHGVVLFRRAEQVEGGLAAVGPIVATAEWVGWGADHSSTAAIVVDPQHVHSAFREYAASLPDLADQRLVYSAVPDGAQHPDEWAALAG